MPDFLERLVDSIGVRMLVVLALVIALLIPLALVRETIHDRQAYRQAAVADIAARHAGAQRLLGPVLLVPYEEGDTSGTWTFFPERSALAGTLVPDTRRRGLHEVRVYELRGRLDATFDVAIPDAPPGVVRRIGQASLAYGIDDVRGLAGSPHLAVDGESLPLQQGMGTGAGGGGIHVRLPAPAPGARLAFDTRLDFVLGGTETLSIAPLARVGRVTIDSAWPHPRFEGDFLPRTRTVDAGGFQAGWEVSSLASNAQAQFVAAQAASAGPERVAARQDLDAIGLSLVDPVNAYVQADRASKYGILFVVLTFGGFFLFETVKRLPIHPIQYLLVGLALAMFFLLLLSLSEHIAFGWAYLAASGACIALLAFYLGFVLRSRLRGLGVAAALALLYAALYGLLVSEDNALLLGSLLLFGVLAAAMTATRRVDWYALGRD